MNNTFIIYLNLLENVDFPCKINVFGLFVFSTLSFGIFHKAAYCSILETSMLVKMLVN